MKIHFLNLLRLGKRTTLCCLVALAIGRVELGAFPIITNVVETGGDAEATDTILAQWTGVTWNTTVANEPTPATPIGTPFTVPVFDRYVPTFVDRNHRYSETSATMPVPSYLVGGEYIMSGNDNRDNATYQLDISVSEPAIVLMLIDNRLSDGGGGDPPNFAEGLDPNLWTAAMAWLGAGGYQPLLTGYNRTTNTTWPDELGIDEGSDGSINQWYSIYYKQVAAGTTSVFQPDNGGRNMYGVVVTPVAPRPPTGLKAVNRNSQVTLNWNVSSGATNYIVKRSDTSGGPYVEVGSTAGTGFTDGGVVNFQTYYYVVSAAGLFAEGANSAEVIGAPKLAPENLVAEGGINEVALSWDALDGAASYKVLRASVTGGPYTEIASGLANLSYVDLGLPDGVRYYYTVAAALTAGGESAIADEAIGITEPGAPTNVVADLFAATVVRVRWTTGDVFPPTTQVEHSTDGLAFTPVGSVANGGLQFLHAGLAPSVTNYYQLRATNSTGASVYSTIVSAITPASGINVNFADTAVTNSADYPIAGYLDDFGLLFADRGNGFSYGWDDDNTQHDRLRNSPNSPDRRYDTFNHLQKTDPLPAARVWEIGIPNGLYFVHIVSGDATATDSTFHWDVEGFVSPALVPAANNWWREFNLTVRVADGRLTLNNGPSAVNNKIAFVDIYPTTPMPNILAVQPVSQTVTQNQTVVLSATVSGGPEPYGFQWYKGVDPIPGANNSTYTLDPVQTTDQGTYSVVVTNAGASVASSNAVLTVVADTFPPSVVSAGTVDGNLIGVCFSEKMDQTEIYNIANFLVNGSSSSVLYTLLEADQRTLLIFMSAPVVGNFTLTVNNQKDLALNAMPSAMVNGVHMGLTAVDVGFPALLGSSFTCDGNTIILSGGGADIWGTSDQGQYAYRMVSGDFDARVRVTSLVGNNAITKALLMARNTIDADSPMVHLSVNPTPPGRDQFEPGIRSAQAGGSVVWGATFVPAGVPNSWLRLTRIGNEWRAYRSSDGANYILSGVTNYAAPSDILLGLAVTAHDNNQIATGAFSGFSVSAPMAEPPTLQFELTASQLKLNWTGDFWLVEADEVTGPWVTNSAATSGFMPPMTAPRKFYGLQPK